MRLMFAARAMADVAGGVQRMILAIMSALAARGHEVSLVTWDRADAASFYPVPEAIKWHRFDLGDPARKAKPSEMLRRASAARALMRRSRPEAVVCFQHGPFISLRLYTLGIPIPFIAAARNAPTRLDHTKAGKRKSLFFNSFRLADRLVIQFESFRHYYPRYLHRRIAAISNPVFPAKLRASPAAPDGNGRFRLLSVGRLGYQKNYGVLIEAFSLIAPGFPDWDLVIVGGGEELEALQQRVAKLGLADRISLPGPNKAIEEQYARAHCFVLPSRWEGFPNVVAEAMAHGLPCAGFADCAGVRDLIQPGQTGALANGNGNAVNLASALSSLMADPEERARMGRNAAQSMSAFAPEEMFDAWERLLTETVARASART